MSAHPWHTRPIRRLYYWLWEVAVAQQIDVHAVYAQLQEAGIPVIHRRHAILDDMRITAEGYEKYKEWRHGR